jgi:glycerol-3-phosphate dehydrogenase
LAGDTCGALLEPTKGVHLVVPDLGHRHAFLLLHPRDGRVFFVIPWLGKSLIGTTDTPPDADPHSGQVEADEIAYLLEGHNHYLRPKLDSSDVMGTFAGLRPLIRAAPSAPSARSREFRMHVSPSGLVTALGGKYTTFRQMAETIVDFVAPRIGKRGRCHTRDLPLDGTPEEAWATYYPRKLAEMRRGLPLSLESARHLVHRYGHHVDAVLDVIRATPHGFDRVHPEEPDLVGEQAYHRAEEMAIYVQDLFLRRTRIGMWRPELLQRQEFSRIG